MIIKDIFVKDIHRPINGVIKADQRDDESIWQELDEYVVTRELGAHLRKFFDTYLRYLDGEGGGASSAIWISGFFGSGKSHFLKVLSYLLENSTVTSGGRTKRAVDFFDGKIDDAMLAADIKRAVQAHTDVILFNVDSRADTSKDDPLLTVFANVFHERLGYSPDHPHIADLERHLDAKGKLDDFRQAYREFSGGEWVEERDAYFLNSDSIKSALARVLGQSEAAFDKWLDDPESVFHLSPDNFALWVKQYIDTKGPKHRIVFLVDEIGQFIGQNTAMMLRLQTIVENLGTVCGGRAWVIVTSQEDIDAVLGELRSTKSNDFSKIQGRFRTRLSLSSADVHEVIQERLLEKTQDARDALVAVYREKADILKNQLSFSGAGMTFKAFGGDDHFSRVYPFAPYQFQLVQKIFEAIRRVGATGLHLARGERSMLDAFQLAATQLSGMEIGQLVPLHRFYASIESFLDTSVKATIDQAADNVSLEPFDGPVLRTLFLIRYVEEIKGTVENLVTLFVDRIDADRLAIRKLMEGSLQRLEGQTLVRRNGEEFFFLTDEEKEIGRGIKGIDLSGGEDVKELGDLVFKQALGSLTKYRFEDTKRDFSFNRFCDQHPVGGKGEGDLAVSVISPLSDDYADWNEARCLAKSNEEGGQVVVKLPDDRKLGRELGIYLKTQKFIARTHDGGLPSTTVRILQDRAAENKQRWDSLVILVGELLKEASYYAAGNRAPVKGGSADGLVRQSLDYLIRNTFTKLGYLKHVCQDTLNEIKLVLGAPDTADQKLNLGDGSVGNPQALKEVLEFVGLKEMQNQKVVLHDLAEVRFGRRPYGWPEWEVVLLVARLVAGGEVSITVDGALLPRDRIYEVAKTPNKWRTLVVVKRRTVDAGILQAARNHAKTVFAKVAPDGEDALYKFLRERCEEWQGKLDGYLKLAATGNYPGKEVIESGLKLLKLILSEKESYGFIKRFVDLKAEFGDLSDNVGDLNTFYGTQLPTWELLRKKRDEFTVNRKELDLRPEAATALKQMDVIHAHVAPYPLIKDVGGLVSKVGAANDELVAARRKHALALIDGHIAEVKAALDQISAPADLRNRSLSGLQALRLSVEKQASIAHIYQASHEAEGLKDDALDAISSYVPPKPAEPPKPPEPPKPSGGKGTAAPPPPPPKPIQQTLPFKKPRVVRPASLKGIGYLKTKSDVDGFLDKLRLELESALAADEPIDIR